MEITISILDAVYLAILIALFILIVYLIGFFKNLIKTIKLSNEILQDVTTISDIAEKRAIEADEVMGDVTKAAKGVAKSLKGNDTVLKQIASISSSLTCFVGAVRQFLSNK